MDATDLTGTWQFFRGDEPVGPAFLHFTGTRAFDYLVDGDVRQILSLWYVLEAPDRIRFRNHPEDEGWTCRVEIDDEKLVIAAEESTTVCTRVRPEDVPQWFREELASRAAREMR